MSDKVKEETSEDTKVEIKARAEMPTDILNAFNGDTEAYNAILTKKEEERNEVIKALLTGKTPERFIRKREGQGGKSFDYVPRGYFEKALNMMFGINGWSTQVKEVLTREKERNGKSITDIAVILRLEYKWGDTVSFKEQAGSAENYESSPYGDGVKKAISDALKKCCSQLGIAGDVYGQSEEDLTGNQETDSKANYNKTQLEAALVRLETKMVDGNLLYEEIERAYEFLKVTKFNDLILRARTLLEQCKKYEKSA